MPIKKTKKYDHRKIEKKWQKEWSASGIYKTGSDPKKPKCYVLDMFPYPSGEGLHVGHPKGYIATDIYSRFKKMNGYNVLHPMGWDAFGLPAENFAIKHKVHPEAAVKKNIKRYKEQLSMIGFDYDWSREINTTDPEYYKWTQWIFLELYKKGLAYESWEPINWCPSCQTGLANEDLEGGKCERCGSEVEKKPMRQWVLRITDYADRLLKDLDSLDWPESVKESQRNWIGRSEGALFKFPLADGSHQVEVFTTRPDTLFGVTFLAVSPELAKKWIGSGWQAGEKVVRFVDEQIAEAAKGGFEEREKKGIDFGAKAIHPITEEELPVWIVNYVLGDVGTGAVMAVPAHDERDFEFAKKYGLPIRQVVESPEADVERGAWSGSGILVNSDRFNGLDSQKAKKDIIKAAGGKPTVQYKLKDWVFSRQRYWGEPIPMVHCAGCAAQKKIAKPKLSINFYNKAIWTALLDGRKTVETRALNPEETTRYFGDVAVGDVIEGVFREAGESRLFRVKKVNIFKNLADLWNDRSLLERVVSDKKHLKSLKALETSYASLAPDYLDRIKANGLVGWEVEPITVPVPVPEKDLPVTLPKVKSYAPTGTGESPLAAIESWVNTKCPICKSPAKRETNTMPQWAGSSWYYLRYIDPKNKKALVDPKKEKYWMPVDMYVGGTEHATRHLIYARFWHKFLFDIGAAGGKEPFMRLKNQGLIAGPDGRKMSKRFGNVINPDDVVGAYGADSFRLYEMFMGPFEQGNAWSTDNMMGARRFVEKVWRLRDKVSADADLKPLETLVHKTIKKVGEDIEAFSFNTAVSAMMVLANGMEKEALIARDHYAAFIRILAPFAPHAAEELWRSLGGKKSVHLEAWPQYDQAKLAAETVNLVVQVNGKTRGTVPIPADTGQDDALEAAKELDSVRKTLAEGEPKKVVFVKNRLINIVI